MFINYLLLIGSVIFFSTYVALKKNIPLFSPFYIIIFSIFSYVLILCISLGSYENLSLHQQTEYIAIFFESIFYFTITFVSVFLIKFKFKYKNSIKDSIRFTPHISRFIYFLLLFTSLFFASKFGWHAFTRNYSSDASIYYSLFSHLKYLIAAYAIFLTHKDKSSLFVMLIFISQIVLAFLDGSRLTLLIYLLCSFMFNRITTVRFFLIFFIIIIFLLIRSYASSDTFLSLLKVEALYGTYSSFQAIELSQYNLTYPFIKLYFLDPLLNTFLKFFQSDLYLKNIFIEQVNDIYLKEKFSPMGGYFLLTDYFLAFGKFGFIPVSIILALTVRFFYSLKKISGLYIFLVIFCCLFVKTEFTNLFTLSLEFGLMFFIINFFSTTIRK